jgi:hypothetical protein
MDTRTSGLNGTAKSTRKPAGKKKAAADPAERAVRRGLVWFQFARGVVNGLTESAWRIQVAVEDGHPLNRVWDRSALAAFIDHLEEGLCQLSNMSVRAPSPVPIPDPIG